MRDDDFADEESYPIDPGVEWEVVQSITCVDEPYRRIWFDIEEIDLETGQRSPAGRMTAGAMCASWNYDICWDPEAYVEWCPGTEPQAECE